MEIISGKIVEVAPDGTIAIRATLPNMSRYIARRYDEVQIGLRDGRRISPEQRRKTYALMGEIAEWAGYEPEDVKAEMKHRFISDHLEALEKELFSLSDCDVTTAREFISYLIDFILRMDVPTHVPLRELCDDVERYGYACLIHRRCAVCGQRAELHHVDAVQMGHDRNRVDHIGRRALALCRAHHTEIHAMGNDAFAEKYHLSYTSIDEKIAKIYRLRGKKHA